MKRVYLDHIAATPLDPGAAEAMRPFLDGRFGNPQSLHGDGQEALEAVEEARGRVAALVGATDSEIIFTASGSEANNFAIKGLALARRDKGCHLVLSAVEHQSVLHSAKSLEKIGFSSTLVPVDKDGLVDPEEVRKAIRQETVLVSVMLANSEVGTIEPLAEISQVCRAAGVTLHTDAVAGVGQHPRRRRRARRGRPQPGRRTSSTVPRAAPRSLSGKASAILPFIDGGIQEGGRRAGTENVTAIVGLGKAAEIAGLKLAERQRGDDRPAGQLIDGLPGRVDHVVLTGHREKRLPHHASFCVEFIEGESMLLNLDMKGIAVSSGSACTSRALKASHVLLAMGHRPRPRPGLARLQPGRRHDRRGHRLCPRGLSADHRPAAQDVAPVHEIPGGKSHMIYSDKVMDHFQNPRNVGVIKDADGTGQVGNPVCGDMMSFYIKVKDDRLEDIKFQTFGCGAAIAVSSMVSEMAMGKTLDEAMKITNEYGGRVAGRAAQEQAPLLEPGGRRPPRGDRRLPEKGAATRGEAVEGTVAESGCTCPYCEGQMGAEEFCDHCQIEFEDCPHCGNLAKKGAEKCPSCGAELSEP